MKRIAAILTVIVALTAVSSSASTTAAEPVPERCTTTAFRPFAAEVWEANWRRGAPKRSTIQAKRARLRCAPPAHRRAMERAWAYHRGRYLEWRAGKLREQARKRRLDRATPYGKWAIPVYIVMCESRGDFRAYNSGYEPHGPGSGPGGAYQIIAQTWAAYGGRAFAAVASEATPLAQHIVAGRIWSAVGGSAWECA